MGIVFGRGLVLLPFFSHTFLQSGEAWGEQGKTGLLLARIQRGGASGELFHLDGTSAQRWRNAYIGLQATANSFRSYVAVRRESGVEECGNPLRYTGTP